MKIYITPYNLNSESARTLANRLGAKLSSGNKRFVKGNSLIINWGNSNDRIFYNVLERDGNKLLNSPGCIQMASDKIETFKRFDLYRVPTVEWTTSRDKAIGWVNEDTYVYSRQYTRSSQGKGIDIVKLEDAMPYAELYTKAIAKAFEYRVHVFKGGVIDFTRKKRRTGVVVNPYIKNSDNGWVFCRDDVTLPDTVRDAAILALRSVDLDFGALDILFKPSINKAYVLEVNTAPGLDGTTLDKYCNKFKEIYNVRLYP